MSGLDISNDLIMIDIACNDPDNGCFAGRAEMISIGNDFIELAAHRDPPPRIVELPDAIRLAGKTWPIHGSKYSVGNWSWNGYWMKIDDAADFLVWLHGRDLYSCDLAETRLYNMWHNAKPFDKDDRHFLWRMLGKPSTFK